MYRGKRQKSSDKNVLSSGSKSSSDRSKRKSDEKRRSCFVAQTKVASHAMRTEGPTTYQWRKESFLQIPPTLQPELPASKSTS